MSLLLSTVFDAVSFTIRIPSSRLSPEAMLADFSWEWRKVRLFLAIRHNRATISPTSPDQIATGQQLTGVGSA